MTLWRRGFIGGLIGGSLYFAVTILLGITTGTRALPDALAERMLSLTPGWLFSFLIGTFQFVAKPLFYVGLILALLILLALGSAWFATRFTENQHGLPLFGRTLAFGGVLFLSEELFIAPLTGDFGRQGSTVVAVASQFIGFLAFGLGLGATLQAFAEPVENTEKTTGNRRTFLRVAMLSALGLVGAGALIQAFGVARGVGAISKPTARTSGSLPPEITPTQDFYSISKNFFDPVVNKSSWKLQVAGHIEMPMDLVEAELRAMPQFDQIATLMCISNEVGGDLISNGAWRGVRLGELLTRAGVKTGAVKVLFTCEDGYTDSITIEKAMEPTTLLALDMNGEKLNDKHGAPVRCVVPNIYGMKHAKWITKIEVVPGDVQGFWQKQGWSDPAPVNTMSRIDYPTLRSPVAHGAVESGGIAFAGQRGISKVEVSYDNGDSWIAATTKEPLSPIAWVFWTATGTIPGAGFVRLMVRAYDKSGAVQSQVASDPYPNGSTGWHTVSVQIT